MMKPLTILILALMVSGCTTSYKAPYLLEEAQQSQLHSFAGFPQVSLGVISPDITSGNRYMNNYGNYGPYDDMTGKVEMTKRLISTFRETGYFKEVNFTNHLSESPDLLVKVKPHPRVPLVGCGMGYYCFFPTLGILPAIIVDDKGNAFEFQSVDSTNSTSVTFNYETEQLLGVFAFLGNLKRDRTYHFDQELYINSLRLSLYQIRSEIGLLLR